MKTFKTAILIGITGLLSGIAYPDGVVKENKAVGSVGETKVVDSKYLITNSGVGDFTVGSPIPFSLSDYQYEEYIEEAEGESYPLYAVWLGEEELLHIIPQYDYVAEQYTKKIGQIIVLSDKYRTAKGVGVNSTIKEFERIYPDYYIWFTYISGMYVLENDEDHTIQYLLNKQDYRGGDIEIQGDINILNRNTFDPKAQINSIRIFGFD